MKKYFTFITIFVFNLSSFAQVPHVLWASQSKNGSGISNTGIALDNNGNSYITGYFSGSVNFGTIALTSKGANDVFVAKLNNNGDFLWVTQGGGDGRDYGYNIAVSNVGEIFVAGYVSEDAWFAEDGSLFVYNQSGYNTSFIAKYNNLGVCQWVKGIESDFENYGYAVTADNSGNAYLTGKYSGKAVFSNLEETAQGSFDTYLIKYSGSGSVLWYKLFGNQGESQSSVVSLDNDNNVYIGGIFNNSYIFGTDTITTNGDFDFFVAKMNSSGQEDWIYTKGSSKADYLNGLKVFSDSSIFISGSFNADISLDDTSLTTNSLQSIYTARLTHKTSGGNGDDDNNTSIFNTLDFRTANIYPNPACEILTISNIPSNSCITISNVQGRVVKKFKNLSSPMNISIVDLEEGIYFVNMTNENSQFVMKLLINRE